MPTGFDPEKFDESELLARKRVLEAFLKESTLLLEDREKAMKNLAAINRTLNRLFREQRMREVAERQRKKKKGPGHKRPR